MGELATFTNLRAGIIQRAYELADSGLFDDSYGMRKALKREGFTDVEIELSGKHLNADLRRRCRMAKGLPPKQAPQSKPTRVRKSRMV